MFLDGGFIAECWEIIVREIRGHAIEIGGYASWVVNLKEKQLYFRMSSRVLVRYWEQIRASKNFHQLIKFCFPFFCYIKQFLR